VASGTLRSRRLDQPDVAVDVSTRVGNTRAVVKGILRDPAHLRTLDLRLSLEKASLGELYPIIGLPLPPTPAYRIQGHLLHRGELWELRQFSGVVGESDLAGDFLIDRGRNPQFMSANLTSERLDLADLAGFIGAEKAGAEKATTPNPARLLPDEPYSLEKLKAADVDIRFQGKQILTKRLPVQDISTRLVVRGVSSLSHRSTSVWQTATSSPTSPLMAAGPSSLPVPTFGHGRSNSISWSPR